MVLGTNHISYSKVGHFISRGLRAHLSTLQMARMVKKENAITKPVFRYAPQFGEKIAIQDSDGSYKYANILISSNKLATEITKALDQKMQERIAFLCPNSAVYVITQWACWISGNIGKLVKCELHLFKKTFLNTGSLKKYTRLKKKLLYNMV